MKKGEKSVKVVTLMAVLFSVDLCRQAPRFVMVHLFIIPSGGPLSRGIIPLQSLRCRPVIDNMLVTGIGAGKSLWTKVIAHPE